MICEFRLFANILFTSILGRFYLNDAPPFLGFVLNDFCSIRTVLTTGFLLSGETSLLFVVLERIIWILARIKGFPALILVLISFF